MYESLRHPSPGALGTGGVSVGLICKKSIPYNKNFTLVDSLVDEIYFLLDPEQLPYKIFSVFFEKLISVLNRPVFI